MTWSVGRLVAWLAHGSFDDDHDGDDDGGDRDDDDGDDDDDENKTSEYTPPACAKTYDIYS